MNYQVLERRSRSNAHPAGVSELAAWITRIRAFWSVKLDALEQELRK